MSMSPVVDILWALLNNKRSKIDWTHVISSQTNIVVERELGKRLRKSKDYLASFCIDEKKETSLGPYSNDYYKMIEINEMLWHTVKVK